MDPNFIEAIKYAPFKLGSVKKILVAIEGTPGGDHWHYVVLLGNGKYGYVNAMCPAEGWSEGSGEGRIRASIDEFTEFLPKKVKGAKRKKLSDDIRKQFHAKNK